MWLAGIIPAPDWIALPSQSGGRNDVVRSASLLPIPRRNLGLLSEWNLGLSDGANLGLRVKYGALETRIESSHGTQLELFTTFVQAEPGAPSWGECRALASRTAGSRT